MIDECIAKEIWNNLTKNKNKPAKHKNQYEYIFKIPYINEKYTMYIKKHTMDLKMKAMSGFKLIPLLKGKNRVPCTYKVCNLSIHCRESHFAHEATCKQSNELYIGPSARQTKNV